MTTSKPSIISRTQAKAADREQRQQARIDGADKMIELAEILVSTHNLVCDKASANEGRGTQVYQLDTSTNVIEAISDEALDTMVFQAEPLHKSKDRQEVLSYVRKLLFTKATLDFVNVAAVAFADESDVVCFKRFAFTKAQAAAISIDDLPEFKFILSLASDPRALTLWLGSLLDWQSARVQYLHWYGGGGNGKSTVFEAIEKALGTSRVVRTRTEDFMSSHWGIELAGARLLVFADTNSTKLFSSGKFKEVTGENYITVNPKNKPHRKIKLTHKIAIISNNKVAINNSAADSRRLLPISSKPDPAGDVPFKWWHAGLIASGEKILLYCFNEWDKAVAADPSLRAGIPAQLAALQEAVEERYGDTLASLEGIVIPKLNDPLEPSVACNDLYKRLADERGGRPLNNNEMKEIKEALEVMGIRKAKAGKGRVFKPCTMKGAT